MFSFVRSYKNSAEANSFPKSRLFANILEQLLKRCIFTPEPVFLEGLLGENRVLELSVGI